MNQRSNIKGLKKRAGSGFPLQGTLLVAAFLLCSSSTLFSQVISNNGAAISVTSNAAVTTKDLTTSGQVSNNGTLVLSGDWTNTGVQASGNGTWWFTGTVNQHIINPANNEKFFNLIVQNTGATVLLDNSLDLGGKLQVRTGTFETGSNNFSVTDSSNIKGTFSDNNVSGTDLFKGPVTIQTGGTWNISGNNDIEFRNGLGYFGSVFNSGTGLYSFTTNNQNLFASSQLVFNASINVHTITLTNKTDVWTTASSSLTSTSVGKWQNDVNSRLRFDYTGPQLIMNGELYASATGNTVWYAGNGNQQIGSKSSYYNLLLGTAGTKKTNAAFNVLHKLSLTDSVTLDMTAGKMQVNDSLLLVKGYIDATGVTNKLTLGNSLSNPGILKYNTGNVYGLFERWLNNIGDILYPVGDKGTGINHSATFNIRSLVSGGSMQVQFLAGDPGSTGLPLVDLNDSSEINYQLKTGWWSAQSQHGFTSANYDLHLIATSMDTVPINPGTRIIKRLLNGNWILDGTHVDAVDPQVNRTSLKSGIGVLPYNEFGLGRSRPLIVKQPRDTAVCDGTQARFTIYVTGTPPLHYQWYKVGTPNIALTNDGHYAQTTTPTLIINAVLADSASQYFCIITDKNGNTNTTNRATLFVNPIPIIFLAATADTICTNTAIVITPGSSVPGSSYSWVNTSDAGITGAHNSTGLSIVDILKNSNLYEASVIYTITPVGPYPTFCKGSSKNEKVHVNPVPRLNVTFSDPDTLLCNNTPWQKQSAIQFTIKTPNTTTGKVWYRLNTTYQVDSITGFSNNIDTQVESIAAGHTFTDSLVNLGYEVESVVYTFTPYIRDAKTGIDCENGVPRSVTIRVLPTLRTNATSDSLGRFVGGWDIRCHSYNTGKISLARNGGYPAFDQGSGYTYLWNGPNYSNTSQGITNLYAGTYNVKVNDNYGCIGYDTITLNQPDTLYGSIEVINSIVCAGIKGKIWIKTNNGGTHLPSPSTEPYFVDWKFGLRAPLRTVPGQHNDTLSNLNAARYWAFLKDANQCAVTAWQDLNGADEVKIDYDKVLYDPVLQTNISCIGSNDGMVRPRLSGGSWPYTITVTGPNNFQYDTTVDDGDKIHWLTNLVPGDYTFLAQDSNKCQKNAYLILTEPPKVNTVLNPSIPYPGIDSIHISCFEKNDGTITPVVTGGYSNYSYLWKGSAPVSDSSSALQVGLAAGTYYLAIADTAVSLNPAWAGNKLCPSYDTIRLIQPENLVITDTVFSHFIGDSITSCYGSADGAVSLTLSGGIGTRDYTWTRLTTGNAGNLQVKAKDQAGITAGNYILRVDYGKSCIAQWNLHLSQPDSMNLNALLPDKNSYKVSCFGGNDGSIQTSLTGGTGPYVFRWSSPDAWIPDSAAANLDSLTIGHYHLQVTDTNGCKQEWSFRLDQPPVLSSLVDSVYPISCNGQEVGGIDITVNGGVPVYSYEWDYGTNPYTEDVRGLDSGMHYVRITDLNNCVTYDSAFITSPDPIVIYDTIFSNYLGYNVSCFNGSDGAIEIHTRGGFGNKTYQWSNGRTAGSISSLSAGTYILVTTDEYQCTDTAVFNLTQPARLMATAQVTDVLCHDSLTGDIKITPVGGVLPYRYNWSNSSVSKNISGLAAGDYELILRDANSCAFDSTIKVIQPTRLNMEVEKMLPYCQETEDGRIAVNISGGAPGYENSSVTMINPDRDIPFLAPGSNNTISVENADVGYFKFHIVDNNACWIDTTVLLEGYRSLCLNIPNVFTPNNDGDNDVWRISYGRHKSDGLDQAYPELVIEVFNRWGQMVYESDKGYPLPWNGTRNGVKLPIDSYYYLIRVNPDAEPITGVVTIVY